jgi:hypothetical protein
VGSYPGSFASLRKIDFRNFNFLSFDKDGKPSPDFALKNGHFQHDEETNHYSYDLDSIHNLPKSALSKGDSALVLISWFAAGGSSSSGGRAIVFTLTSSHLRVVQELDCDTHFHAGGPTDSFNPATNSLVIRSAHYIPGDAHCCVSAMDVVSFRWDGVRLVQTGLQTELSEYGRTERRSLPRSVLQ